jgi:hypothetical protein
MPARFPGLSVCLMLTLPETLNAEHIRDVILRDGRSRGVHGIKSLGSVSERVAHQARCSVVVVR